MFRGLGVQALGFRAFTSRVSLGPVWKSVLFLLSHLTIFKG